MLCKNSLVWARGFAEKKEAEKTYLTVRILSGVKAVFVVLDRPQCLTTVWKIASIQNSLLTGQGLNGIIKVKRKTNKGKRKKI